MTLRFQAICDGCGCTHERPEDPQSTLTARGAAAADGWEYDDVSGGDYCPACQSSAVLR